MVGKTILHYKIFEKLGEGGMGVVYKAEDTRLKRTVALKFLPLHTVASDEDKTRFAHEAQAAASLDHPNICTVHEINEVDGQTFIVMAYVEGQSLQDIVGANGRLPLRINDTLDYAIQIAEGLQAAHERGVIHRDIKPANILITEKGHVRITDFGLAKLAGRTQLTKEGTSMGTVAYMSPEQTQGADVDHRTDIWALGTVIYEMITGRQPFAGDYEQAVIYSIMNEVPEPPTALRTGVPMELERIILKALAKGPTERYQHVDEMLVDLKSLRKAQESGIGKTSNAAGTLTGVETLSGFRTKTPILVGSVLVLLLAVAFLLLRPFLQEEPAISGPRPLVVMPFENQTGDASLDYLKAAIPNLLITNLEQSKYLSVLTWQRLGDLLKQLGKDSLDVVEMDQETGFEVCKLDRVHGIVIGSFTKAGEVFATDIKVLDVRSKKTLKSANARGKGVGSILESQIDALSKAISQAVAILPEQAEPEKLRVADVTTSSMEAYRHYLDGLNHNLDFNFTHSKASLKQALAIDSTLATAYYLLAATERGLRDFKAARVAAEKAMRYIAHTTPKEALYIRAFYAWRVENDLEAAIRIDEELTAKFPREKTAHYLLAIKYSRAFQYEKSIAAYETCIALDPKWSPARNGLAYMYAATELYEKALEHLEKYVELSPDIPNPNDTLGDIFWMMGRLDEAISQWEQAIDKDSKWTMGMFKQGFTYAIKDDYVRAAGVQDKLSALLQRFPSLSEIPRHKQNALVLRAFLDFYTGRYEGAWRSYRELLKSGQKSGNVSAETFALDGAVSILLANRDYEGAEKQWLQTRELKLQQLPQDSLRWRLAYRCLSGLTHAYAGRTETAHRKLEEAKRLYPRVQHEALEIYAEWLARLEGEIALLRGDVMEAIRVFSQALSPRPYLALNYTDYYFHIRRDGLARAYHANGDLDAAIEEYRKLLKFDPAQRGRYIVDPKNHYRLAKLYEDKGWPGLAMQEYEIFLDLWQDADPDLPELVDAREQLAKLKRSGE